MSINAGYLNILSVGINSTGQPTIEAEKKLDDVINSLLAILFGPLNKTENGFAAPSTDLTPIGEAKNVSETAPITLEQVSDVELLSEKVSASGPPVSFEPLGSGENFEPWRRIAFIGQNNQDLGLDNNNYNALKFHHKAK